MKSVLLFLVLGLLSPCWSQESTRTRVDLPSASQSQSAVVIEHVPAPDAGATAVVRVEEQPRPAPRITIIGGCPTPAASPPVMAGAPPVTYHCQPQSVLVAPRLAPSDCRDIARLYLWTHYRERPKLFTFTRPRYVPRRENDPARRIWDDYVRRHLEQ